MREMKEWRESGGQRCTASERDSGDPADVGGARRTGMGAIPGAGHRVRPDSEGLSGRGTGDDGRAAGSGGSTCASSTRFSEVKGGKGPGVAVRDGSARYHNRVVAQHLSRFRKGSEDGSSEWPRPAGRHK
jgi:hypothetical protein